MEDVLDTYALAPDPDRPLVNFDEFSKQLLSEFPATSRKAFDWNRRGTSRRQDSEYVREGSASAFMIAAPHLGVREVFVGTRWPAYGARLCCGHRVHVRCDVPGS